MKANVELNEFEIMAQRLERVARDLKELEDAGKNIIMLDINRVAELTGWNKQTVNRMFNRPDFPAQCFGKSRLVEVTALRDFFSKRHDRQ